MLECTTSRVNLKINYGHWMITMRHSGFINYNKSKTMARDVNNRVSGTCMGIGRSLYVPLNLTVKLKLP